MQTYLLYFILFELNSALYEKDKTVFKRMWLSTIILIKVHNSADNSDLKDAKKQLPLRSFKIRVLFSTTTPFSIFEAANES